MAGPLNDWLNDVPGVGLVSTHRRATSPESYLESPTKIVPDTREPSVGRSFSSSSSSNNSSSSITDALSRKSSASTVPSTAPTLNVQVPWHVQVGTLPHIAAMHIDTHYLPCEFAFAGCQIRFHSDDYDPWVQHSLSHLPDSGPPSKAVCTICDADDAVFIIEGNRHQRNLLWRTRLWHIAEHFREGSRYEDMRPDFFVIKHMAGLLSDEDFKFAMSYTERPSSGLNLVPSGFKTPQMQAKEKRNNIRVYDQEKEDRQRRRLR